MSYFSFIVYIIIGVLITLAFTYVYGVHKGERLDIRTWVFAIISILHFALGLGWAYVSLLEKEGTAAFVGLVLFGGLGVVFGFLTLRGMRKPAALKE